MKKSFGERKHAGNPAVEAAREHYRTRARRRTVRQYWHKRGGWIHYEVDPVTGQRVEWRPVQ